MATSMRRMQVRYAQYEDTEYVHDNTKSGKRVAQEPAGDRKLMKLVHDDGPKEHASKRAHWDFGYNIRKTLIAHPIVEARSGLSNLQRNAQEQADAKARVAKLEWSQVAQLTASSKLKAQHEKEIGHLKQHGQAIVDQRCGDIQKLVTRAERNQRELEAASVQQQTILQDEISEEREERERVLDEKNRVTDYAKTLLQGARDLQHQFDQQSIELDEFRHRNQELMESNRALNTELSQVKEDDVVAHEEYETVRGSMVKGQTAIAQLYSDACPSEDIQLDASMTGVEADDSVVDKCAHIAEVLQSLRSANVFLKEEKAAAEQERDEAYQDCKEISEMANQLRSRDEEIVGMREESAAIEKYMRDMKVQKELGRDFPSDTKAEITDASWMGKEKQAEPVKAAPMTPATFKSVETSLDKSASAAIEDTTKQAGCLGAGRLPTPESITADSCDAPSAFAITPAGKAKRPQPQNGKNFMRDIGKPQHRSSKTTKAHSMAKTSGVAKPTSHVKAAVQTKSVSKNKKLAFAAKLHRLAKETASTRNELDQKQQWLVDNGRVLSERQQEQDLRRQIVHKKQLWLDEMQSRYDRHFNRVRYLEKLHHPEEDMKEIFGNTFRGGSEDLGATEELEDFDKYDVEED